MNIILDLLILSLTFIYALATILIPVQLKKRDKITKFQARKAVHLFAGLAVLSAPYYSWPWWAVILASSMTLLTLLSSKKSSVKQLKDLYDSIGEEAEQKVGYLQGPFHYCLSITILITTFVIFAPDQMYFPIAGILLMIISDTLASIIGKKYGKRKINLPWLKTIRSLEGSIAFFVSGFMVCFFAFTFLGVSNPLTQVHLSVGVALLYSLITSTLATIIELISPSTWDDLTIPIATVVCVFLLTLI